LGLYLEDFEINRAAERVAGQDVSAVIPAAPEGIVQPKTAGGGRAILLAGGIGITPLLMTFATKERVDCLRQDFRSKGSR
jgi:ferredoxin-NADP reductase